MRQEVEKQCECFQTEFTMELTIKDTVNSDSSVFFKQSKTKKQCGGAWFPVSLSTDIIHEKMSDNTIFLHGIKATEAHVL